MRTALAVLALSIGSTLSAANLYFDPPNPKSDTPVVAHVLLTGTPCGSNADVQRNGDIISITLPVQNCVAPPVPGFFEIRVNLGVLPAGVYDVIAGEGNPLVTVAEGKLAVRDAQPPFALFPDAGREGDTVAIPGAGNCASACSVTFGGVAAPAPDSSGSTILVKVPHAGPGPVDVTVNGRTAIAAFDVISGDTVDAAFFTPVLVPVFFSGNGALGSQWRTELLLANENASAVPIDTPLFATPCIGPNGCFSGIPAGLRGIEVGQSDTEGRLFHLDRQAAPSVFLDARIRDLSREAQDLGAELPVVREKNFIGGAFDLLNVPTDVHSRVALRIYRIDGGTFAYVSIRPMFAPPQMFVTARLDLHAAGGMQVLTFPDLVAAYPQLAGKGPLIITIDSSSPQPATWAFVSVTNNETQRVTIISPQ